MMRRIFISVTIPETLKQEIVSVRDVLPEVPCRWIPRENLHFTLVFLGNMSDKELEAVLEMARGVGQRHRKFSLTLARVRYGPDQHHPRMIWAVGDISSELLSLQNDFERTLASSSKLHFILQKRPYSLHLTLGRLDMFELQSMEQYELPVLDEEISWIVPIQSFDVMESRLKRGGAEYSVVSSFVLGKPS